MILLAKPVVIAVVGLLFSAAAQGKAADSWMGTYGYQAMIPRDTLPMIFEIILEIDEDGTCILTHDGFQTYDHMACRIIPDTSSVSILYEDDADESGSQKKYKKG